MRNVSDKQTFVETIKTYILFSKTVFFNSTVYEIIWKNRHSRTGRDKTNRKTQERVKRRSRKGCMFSSG